MSCRGEEKKETNIFLGGRLFSEQKKGRVDIARIELGTVNSGKSAILVGCGYKDELQYR